MISTRSRRTALVLGTATALVAGGTGLAEAATAPKPFHGTTIDVQKSMGGIALGATEKQLEKFFGASHCSTGGCNYTGSHNSYTVSAGIASTGTKVTQIVFQSQSLAAPARRMHTNKKIGIGSTLTQLKKAYPKVKKSVGPGVGVTYYALESSHRDTRFVVNGKKKIFEIDLFAS